MKNQMPWLKLITKTEKYVNKGGPFSLDCVQAKARLPFITHHL